MMSCKLDAPVSLHSRKRMSETSEWVGWTSGPVRNLHGRKKRLALSRSRTMFICRQASILVTMPIALPRLHSLSSFLISETDPPLLQGNQHSNWCYIPTGSRMKNGNQQSRKPPTTMPSVLAAFFCRRNFARRPFSPATVSLRLSSLKDPASPP